MTGSYLTVSIRLGRKGWKHFSTDVTDAVIGTETELTEIDSGKTLGAEVGDKADTVQELVVSCEHYCRYITFARDTIAKMSLPGPRAALIGPAGTEVVAGGTVRYRGGEDFAPFSVSSAWALLGNTSADGTGA